MLDGVAVVADYFPLWGHRASDFHVACVNDSIGSLWLHYYCHVPVAARINLMVARRSIYLRACALSGLLPSVPPLWSFFVERLVAPIVQPFAMFSAFVVK